MTQEPSPVGAARRSVQREHSGGAFRFWDQGERQGKGFEGTDWIYPLDGGA
jgi:hypothetical protein